MTIHKGDIIRVLQDIYITFPGGKYCNHFVKKEVLYLVQTEPTNNGNFQAINTKGIFRHFNERQKNIIAIYTR